MPDDPYTLADLARLADVTPRTVRYYVAQGLLPSPESAGPATRYGEGHLARLRLIKWLQRDHLPLAEIRIRIEQMGDDEIIAAVSALDPAEPDPSRDPGDTLGFVQALMARTGVRPTTRAPAPALLRRMDLASSLDEAWEQRAGDLAPSSASVPPAAPLPAAALVAAAEPPPNRAVAASSRPVHDRSTWERLVISPDVELHVRRPLDRTTNKRVDQLERIARELFDDT